MRLVDEEGKQVGIIRMKDALKHAYDAGLDLVEVSPNSSPPVCRIMDYGKYRYEIIRRLKIARKKKHVVHIKEIKMRPEISDHDFEFKIRHAIEFIKHKDKVKFTIFFRGREILHKDHGEELLKRVVAALGDNAVVETDIHLEGRNLTMLVTGK